MNFEADDLLKLVDQWKFKLHEKLKSMTAEERTGFWKRSLDRARTAGLPIAAEDLPAKRRPSS